MDLLVRQRDEAKQLAKHEAEQLKAATDQLAHQDQELGGLKVCSRIARLTFVCIWQLFHAMHILFINITQQKYNCNRSTPTTRHALCMSNDELQIVQTADRPQQA